MISKPRDTSTNVDDPRKPQMTGHGSKFPRKKQEAIAALLTEPTIREAANTAGISEKTLWRWLQDQKFSQSYRDAKRRVVAQAVSRLQAVSGEAVDTLKEIMTDSDNPSNTRVTAARIILEITIKAVENEDIVSRIERLETLIERRR